MWARNERETWDDPERSPENRRSGTAELRPSPAPCRNYIWALLLLLLNRRNGHGGNPKPDRQRSNGFASGSGWARPPALRG